MKQLARTDRPPEATACVQNLSMFDDADDADLTALLAPQLCDRMVKSIWSYESWKLSQARHLLKNWFMILVTLLIPFSRKFGSSNHAAMIAIVTLWCVMTFVALTRGVHPCLTQGIYCKNGL